MPVISVIDTRRESCVERCSFAVSSISSREIGDRGGEGARLGNLGNAYSSLGEVRRAIEYYEQALVIDREIDYRRGEGNQLANMGLAYEQLGDTKQARRCWEQALEIYIQIESPYADQVRGWLAKLDEKEAKRNEDLRRKRA